MRHLASLLCLNGGSSKNRVTDIQCSRRTGTSECHIIACKGAVSNVRTVMNMAWRKGGIREVDEEVPTGSAVRLRRSPQSGGCPATKCSSCNCCRRGGGVESSAKVALINHDVRVWPKVTEFEAQEGSFRCHTTFCFRVKLLFGGAQSRLSLAGFTA